MSGSVEVRKGKRGDTFYLRLRYADGRQGRPRLGRVWKGSGRPASGYLTSRMAKEELWKVLAGAEDPRRQTAVFFSTAADEFLRYLEIDRRRKKSTIDDYRSVLSKHLVPAFGRSRLERVSSHDVEQFRRGLVAKGSLAPRTINKLLVILGGLFSWAREVYGLRQNPLEGIRLQPVVSSGDLVVLSPDELEAVGRAADGSPLGELFRVAGYTGLRLGEVRALRVDDLDFTNRIVHVRAGFTHGQPTTPKNHRVRSVPMIDQAKEAFLRVLDREAAAGTDDLLFPSPRTGSYMSDSYPRNHLYLALESAGLGHLRDPDHRPHPFRFHDLRHTFGSLAVKEFPITDVKEFMGHADIQTTMQYIHFVPRHDAAARLSRAFTTDPETLQTGREVGRKVVASDSG